MNCPNVLCCVFFVPVWGLEMNPRVTICRLLSLSFSKRVLKGVNFCCNVVFGMVRVLKGVNFCCNAVYSMVRVLKGVNFCRRAE